VIDFVEILVDWVYHYDMVDRLVRVDSYLEVDRVDYY